MNRFKYLTYHGMNAVVKDLKNLGLKPKKNSNLDVAACKKEKAISKLMVFKILGMEY